MCMFVFPSVRISVLCLMYVDVPASRPAVLSRAASGICGGTVRMRLGMSMICP